MYVYVYFDPQDTYICMFVRLWPLNMCVRLEVDGSSHTDSPRLFICIYIYV